MRKVLSTFTLLLAAQQSFASTDVTLPSKQDKPRWYQADMVVFVNERSMAASDKAGTEKWPAIMAHPLPKNAIKLKTPTTGLGETQQTVNLNDWLSGDKPAPSAIDLERDAFVDLPYQFQLLQKQGNALERQSGYRILQRKAWLMPIRDGESTKPIAIQNYNLSSRNNSLLEGTITVNSSRFMHVSVDLWFNELVQERLSGILSQDSDVEVQPEPSADGKPVIRRNMQMVRLPDGQPMRITRNFQLKESRRIRNTDEIQYLDSPVIGVLFKLTPYEWPEKPLLPEIDSSALKPAELGILPGIIKSEKS